MDDLTTNSTCASCGCVGHGLHKFESVSVTDPSLCYLHVDLKLVPFRFASGISDLGNLQIMVDPDGIVHSPTSSDATPSLSLCRACRAALINGVQPRESLANYRWVGPVPPELDSLTWIEESLISRAHLAGRIVCLQDRNSTSYFSLKGHVVLLPQDTSQ
jgi:hypothetical protein